MNKRWPHPRHWGISEWGSVASLIGIGLWVYDRVKTMRTKA